VIIHAGWELLTQPAPWGVCLQGEAPVWLISYIAEALRFVEYERRVLPSVFMKTNVEGQFECPRPVEPLRWPHLHMPAVFRSVTSSHSGTVP
jgi:hypothetical protein